ncbi:MAG: hypothetical protein ACRDIY_03020 [Chloroflexota bacterium]
MKAGNVIVLVGSAALAVAFIAQVLSAPSSAPSTPTTAPATASTSSVANGQPTPDPVGYLNDQEASVVVAQGALSELARQSIAATHDLTLLHKLDWTVGVSVGAGMLQSSADSLKEYHVVPPALARLDSRCTKLGQDLGALSDE